MSNYAINILGRKFIVRRTIPRKVQSPSGGNARLHYIMETPLTALYGMNSNLHDIHYDEASNIFDSTKIQLENGLRVAEFCEKAIAENPSLTKQKAYNAYSLKKFDMGYSQLIEKQKKSLIKKFRAAFESIDRESIEISSPFPFLNNHLSCTLTTIAEFEELANQGHSYSQFMAGLLLTTMAGDFSETGISYLLAAYENRFPRSMDALAEFLLYKKDFYGAVQCHLLSLDSLDDCSHTMDTIKQLTQRLVINKKPFMPLLPYIFNYYLDNDFITLAKKHYPDFYLSENEKSKDIEVLSFGREVE